MNVIWYNYKLSTKIPCGHCSFHKIGLLFITVCVNCHGNNCTSVSKFEIIDDSEDQSFERNAFEIFNI